MMETIEFFHLDIYSSKIKFYTDKIIGLQVIVNLILSSKNELPKRKWKEKTAIKTQKDILE